MQRLNKMALLSSLSIEIGEKDKEKKKLNDHSIGRTRKKKKKKRTKRELDASVIFKTGEAGTAAPKPAGFGQARCGHQT